MDDIIKKQMTALNGIAREAGVFAWEFGVVQNPMDPRSEWEWRFFKCRHEEDRHHGGAEVMLREMRKANAAIKDIYVRPSPGKDESSIVQYSYFVLDDVPETIARQIASQNRALVVRTSTEGGCQVWIFTIEGLTRVQRLAVQQHFQKKIGSDGGAVSGIQFSRMPGFKNYKRGGQWVNVLVKQPRGNRLSVSHIFTKEQPNEDSRLPDNAPKEFGPEYPHSAEAVLPFSGSQIVDVSPQSPLCDSLSGKTQSEVDFYFCIRNLKLKIPDEHIIVSLTASATRKGKNAEKYAVRTVAAARKALQL